MKRRLRSCVVAMAVFSCSAALAEVRLSAVFGNNMVLQRGMPVPVWGMAGPGEQVTVSFGRQRERAAAGANGRWRVTLDTMPASEEGRELIIEGANRIVFKNVLVGEVWVCSGQSNMEWTVGGALDRQRETQAADFPLIRHIKVDKRPSDRHETTFRGSWAVCSARTVGGFTAVGYFFGREIHRKLGVPVGLVNSSWGGTRIEPWTPLVGFRMITGGGFGKIIDRIEQADPRSEAGRARYRKAIAEYREWLDKAEVSVDRGEAPPAPPSMPSLGRSHQDPTRLFRGMISPLVSFAIRGAIWYQGESNGGESMSYYHKKHALVKGWREVWGQGDFPFYWVQLANFRADNKRPEGGDGYAKIRDAERKALDIPNTGMATIIDIGNTRDIHPKNKQDVGWRLAQWALAGPYGLDVVPSGPLYKRHAVESGTVRVWFDHVGSGLMVGEKKGLEPTREAQGAKLQRFAVAGQDKKWVWAEARIDGDTVVVSSPDVRSPVAVRYAYSGNPLGANLYNREGMPASPFRTDEW
ncbi:MAG: sialate O-acetylesterase [Planctomycetota bacterium]